MGGLAFGVGIMMLLDDGISRSELSWRGLACIALGALSVVTSLGLAA